MSNETPKEIKEELHPRNKHKHNYNFPELVKTCKELAPFVSKNKFGNLSIDFKDPEAVKTLNKALLSNFYDIKEWDIPEGYLCPPIPGRVDYIHYLADLLAKERKNGIPKGKKVKVLDVGMGANCIYPLLGHKIYGWEFVGSDINHLAINYANRLIKANNLLHGISIREQQSTRQIFNGIIEEGEKFDLTMCNPPFHASLKEAIAGSERKSKNLGQKKSVLNFGGKSVELWCKGGEEQFLKDMIYESSLFKDSCLWFTSLISKKETLPKCRVSLERVNATEVKVISMAQGQKVSRVLAWTFLNAEERKAWLDK